MSLGPFALVGQDAAPAITPETQFLELIDLEEDASKQLPLIDLFLKQFPKYDGIAAVYSLAQAGCVKLREFDRALDFGAKLLQIDSGDLQAVKLNLEAAEGKKDAVLTAKWKQQLDLLQTAAAEGAVTANSRVNTPYVEGGDAESSQIEVMTPRERNLRSRTEAIAFNRILEAAEGPAKLQLLEEFTKQFPNSQHANNVRYLYFLAYSAMKDEARTLAIAETLLLTDRTREDVLLFAASAYYGQKRNYDKTLSYCATLLALAAGKTRPEEMSEEAWQTRRRTMILQAHWITAMIHLQQERWSAADASLRAAFPLSTSQEMTSGLLHSLGWANYKMRRIPEALRYFEQCSKAPGPFQAQAASSILSIKSEYALQ